MKTNRYFENQKNFEQKSQETHKSMPQSKTEQAVKLIEETVALNKAINKVFDQIKEGKTDKAIVREDGPGHKTVEIVLLSDESVAKTTDESSTQKRSNKRNKKEQKRKTK